jgi:WD40 repeat protein
MLVKAFRLFVSSTFADFSAERDVLQRHVFPALDHYCAAKGYQFDALDLRWGVNEEAQLDQRTEEICLAEIRAAKQGYPPPNFLILLGDRYGFVPLPYAIAQDEFDAILAWLEGAGRQNAVAELCGVYRRDDNYLLPRGLSGSATDGGPLVGSYTLRSRIDELLDLRAAGPWAEHEAKLRAILQQTSDGLLAAGRIDAATHEKYFLSLTDREIIAGLPEYRKLPNGGTLSPSLAPDGAPAIAFIRDIANESRAPVEVARLFFENEPRLETLKERLKGALTSDQVITLRTNIDDRGELPPVYLAEFAVQIEGKLRSAIDRYIARVEAVELSPDYALTSEQDVHRTFAQTKLEVFVGRENALATIARYLAGAGDQPLVLHGRSGIGKSALMARAFLDALAMGSAPVVVRFVGASAASSNLQALLGSIVDDLAAHGIVEKPAELEQNANKFRDQVRELLSCVSGPAIIYLDGLDQLQKPLDLGWLPSKLPEGFKAVLSALNDPAYPADSLAYQELRKRFAPDSFLEIKPLGRAQGREILTRFERQAGCRLQDGQRGYVIHKFAQAGASPLYLRTAFAIARNWKSFHQAGAGRYVLADDTQGLVAQFIAELSSVQHHESELVTHTLGYLAAAKNGLSQKELTEILSRDAGVMSVVSSRPHGAVTEKLPPSVWVRLNRDLSPFLIQKQIDEQPLLQFFHREVLRVARKRHYEACKTELHSALAAYFESQATDGDDGVVYGKRSLSELPYQFQNAGNISRLDEILVSPDWMQQKLNAFGPQILVADYDRYATRDMQRLIGRTLRLTASICSRDPCQLLPQLLGRLIARADPAVASFLDDARRHLRLPALVTQRPSLRPPGAEIARLEGHTHVVTTLAVLPDGRLASASWDGTFRVWDMETGAEMARVQGRKGHVHPLAALPDGRLASGSWDGTIRLWDVRTGAETARLEGHTLWVTAVAALPDGRLASGSEDETIRVWDPNTYAETVRIEGGRVSTLAALPDGRLASARGPRHDPNADDKAIRLWNSTTGAEAARLEGHTAGVNALAILPDGRLASGSWDGTIRLWDVRTGAETARLEVHSVEENKGILGLAALPDGRLALRCLSTTISIWDPNVGVETARLEGHTEGVTALAVLLDGRLASGSGNFVLENRGYARDNTIRLWDLKRATEITPLAGHTSWVSALARLPDGRLASSSRDTTIRLWDPETGAATVLAAHIGFILALAVLPDGRLASAPGWHRHRVYGVADGTIRLWDLKTGTETARLEGHTNGVNALSVVPDGRLASASDDRTIRLWDPENGAETGRIEDLDQPVYTLSVLPDGRLASGGNDDLIRLWDLKTGAETARLQGHKRAVTALAVLPNGPLASAAMDNTIRLWDVKTGAEIDRLEGHTGSVEALAALPNGWLASGSWDNTIRVWDIGGQVTSSSRAKEIARLEMDSAVRSLAALPNGQFVAGDEAGGLHWLEIVGCPPGNRYAPPA